VIYQRNEVLVSILEMLRTQALYLHIQHGWLIAVAETIEKHPQLVEELKRHPFYDQGPQPALRNTDVMIGNINALIAQLKG
jgi:hypothetical protein